MKLWTKKYLKRQEEEEEEVLQQMQGLISLSQCGIA